MTHDYNFQTIEHLLDLRAVVKVHLNDAEQTHIIWLCQALLSSNQLWGLIFILGLKKLAPRVQ